MLEIWTEKYRPKNLKEFKGNSKKVKEIIDWVKNWKNEKQNSILLFGGPGTGKTTIAKVIASELDLELVETNASDIRTKESLKENIEQSTRQTSFFKKGKIILIDEVDGISSSDRGGVPEILKLISESKFPIILTANDAYDPKLTRIRSKSKTIKFGAIRQNEIRDRLKEICRKEKIEFEDEAIKSIARRSSGDLRSAINDLFFLARGHEKVDSNTLKELESRDINKEIFEALMIIFKTKNLDTALKSTENLTENYDMLFNWIRENIPLEYEKNEEVALAYDFLSKADMFNGRIIKRQYWGLLKYSYDLLCGGVAISKHEKYRKFTRYNFPRVIKKMGISKSKRTLRKTLGSKLSKKLHVSGRRSLEEIELIKILFRKKELKENLVRNLELDNDEIKFIEQA